MDSYVSHMRGSMPSNNLDDEPILSWFHTGANTQHLIPTNPAIASTPLALWDSDITQEVLEYNPAVSSEPPAPRAQPELGLSWMIHNEALPTDESHALAGGIVRLSGPTVSQFGLNTLSFVTTSGYGPAYVASDDTGDIQNNALTYQTGFTPAQPGLSGYQVNLFQDQAMVDLVVGNSLQPVASGTQAFASAFPWGTGPVPWLWQDGSAKFSTNSSMLNQQTVQQDVRRQLDDAPRQSTESVPTPTATVFHVTTTQDSSTSGKEKKRKRGASPPPVVDFRTIMEPDQPPQYVFQVDIPNRPSHMRQRTEEEQHKRQKILAISPCIRCRMYRKKCSEGIPCEECRKVLRKSGSCEGSSWKWTCARVDLYSSIQDDSHFMLRTELEIDAIATSCHSSRDEVVRDLSQIIRLVNDDDGKRRRYRLHAKRAAQRYKHLFSLPEDPEEADLGPASVESLRSNYFYLYLFPQLYRVTLESRYSELIAESQVRDLKTPEIARLMELASGLLSTAKEDRTSKLFQYMAKFSIVREFLDCVRSLLADRLPRLVETSVRDVQERYWKILKDLRERLTPHFEREHQRPRQQWLDEKIEVYKEIVKSYEAVIRGVKFRAESESLPYLIFKDTVGTKSKFLMRSIEKCREQFMLSLPPLQSSKAMYDQKLSELEMDRNRLDSQDSSTGSPPPLPAPERPGAVWPLGWQRFPGRLRWISPL